MEDKYKNIDNELDKLDKLCGLELRFDVIKNLGDISPKVIETYRRMDDLYNELSIARYNLLMSVRDSYPEIVEQDQKGYGNRWTQYSFINTATMWYDNCFDIMLQFVWFYYDIKKSQNDPTAWNKETIKQMQIKCRYENIEKWGNQDQFSSIFNNIKTFYQNKTTFRVREWANDIKHRKPLRINGVGHKNNTRIIFFSEIEIDGNKINAVNTGNKYDSGDVDQWYDPYYVIDELIEYHKNLVKCIESLADPIIEAHKDSLVPINGFICRENP